MKSILKYVTIALVGGFLSTPAQAEVMITGASCLPEGSYFSKRFENFVADVNEQGKGVIQINYLGGAPAIGDPFSVGLKIAKGAYDIGNCTGAYYQSALPIADVWKLLERTPDELRENGGWDYITRLHREVNLVPIARLHYGVPFHLYLGPDNKIDSPDLSGLHLRVSPIYTNFFQAMGATTQQTSSTDIFPLMENGTIVGYGWPITGMRPGWETVTKYRVDPGFYEVDFQLLVNAKMWDGLPQEARDLIQKIALEHEAKAGEQDAADIVSAQKKQIDEFGFEVIKFEGEEAEAWLKGAREAGWAGIAKINEEQAKELRKTFAKE
ncbi:type 2 periplasmic-binding domain-containing protein [Sneathiella chungangensis]